MTSEDLCALVAALARDRRRFTLEDAAHEGDGGNNGADDDVWVIYLYDARPAVTYRVADYHAFQVHHARDAALPPAWAAPAPRPDRNGGRDYSEEEAYITLADLTRVLASDATAGDGTARLQSLHVRYADDGDDRYHVVVRAPTGDDRALTTLAAYHGATR
jgi:hypothetical protein